jgi:hypothetical protein
MRDDGQEYVSDSDGMTHMIRYVGKPMPTVTMAKGRKESLGGILVMPKI